jgi:hypothetical protein
VAVSSVVAAAGSTADTVLVTVLGVVDVVVVVLVAAVFVIVTATVVVLSTGKIGGVVPGNVHASGPHSIPVVCR